MSLKIRERVRHYCRYCGRVTPGSDEDILCDRCRKTFGHARYSDLYNIINYLTTPWPIQARKFRYLDAQWVRAILEKRGETLTIEEVELL